MVYKTEIYRITDEFSKGLLCLTTPVLELFISKYGTRHYHPKVHLCHVSSSRVDGRGTFSPLNMCSKYFYTFQAPGFIRFKLKSSVFDLQDIDGIENIIDFLFQLFLLHFCALWTATLNTSVAPLIVKVNWVWGYLSIFLAHVSRACSYCFIGRVRKSTRNGC